MLQRRLSFLVPNVPLWLSNELMATAYYTFGFLLNVCTAAAVGSSNGVLSILLAMEEGAIITQTTFRTFHINFYVSPPLRLI